MAQIGIAAQIPGLLTAQIGIPVAVHTVGAFALTGVQVDAYLIESAPTDTVIRIGDGTVDHTLTIPAGTKSRRDLLSGLTWPPAAVIEIEVVTAAGFVASTLGLNLYVSDSQPTGALGDGLVTLDELKTALGLGLSAHAADPWFARQITVVSDLIRRYCGRHFNRSTIRSTWISPDVVLSAEYPLESITSATADGVALVVATELGFNPRNGTIWRMSGTEKRSWRNVRNLEITYVAGTDPVPPVVAECVFLGIAEKFATYGVDNGLSGQQTTIGVTFPEAAGAVRFANASQLEQGDLVHYLAGFPLGLLDSYVDLSRMHASADEVWTFV